MPIIKTKSGYKFGKSGKEYKTKQKALKQMRAIKSNQKKRGKR